VLRGGQRDVNPSKVATLARPQRRGEATTLKSIMGLIAARSRTGHWKACHRDDVPMGGDPWWRLRILRSR
jgi:hypothetical protein